jgi:hypothetical protein
MKPLFFSLCLAGFAGLFTGTTASAVGPGGFAGQGNLGFPFVPFGFYQPYGAQYRSSLPTPPYFALNPPVYYGSRFARPYGLSPFAAPPMMDAPAEYRGTPATQFVRPPVNNPYIVESCDAGCAKTTPNRTTELASANVAGYRHGEVQFNPFTSEQTESGRVAQR